MLRLVLAVSAAVCLYPAANAQQAASVESAAALPNHSLFSCGDKNVVLVERRDGRVATVQTAVIDGGKEPTSTTEAWDDTGVIFFRSANGYSRLTDNELLSVSADGQETLSCERKDREKLVELAIGMIAKKEEHASQRINSMQAQLSRARADLGAAQATVLSLTQERVATESQLRAALTARQKAESAVTDHENQINMKEALLEKARRETALLNQQIAALRTQLEQLKGLLDDYAERDATAVRQIQNLGADLNAALAHGASEERKRRLLEENERKRLEEEARELAAQSQAKDLEKYRSEFFGRLRDLLGNQGGVRIAGDRFVFSSEVLFAPGNAELSPDGEVEIAKVARILRTIADEIPAEINWMIRIDGHTDNIPLGGTGKYSDNWELSQGRALSVVKYMTTALGIPPDRLSANGFGEYQPMNLANTPEARAQNRRIEIKLTEK